MPIYLKRYQIAILFFAIGIFLATSLGIYLVKLRNESIEAVVPSREYRTVLIYFSNSDYDPGTLECGTTYPVERAVSRLTDNSKSALAEYVYLAISELLKGPAGYEKDNGYFTLINEGTKIQNIIIENEIATVDFNEKLNEGVAGSCTVMAIRSQITNTLLRFPEIKEVIISANGRSEDILQP